MLLRAYRDIEASPDINEVIKVIILQKRTHRIVCRREALQDDSDEQVEKDQRNDQVETNKVHGAHE